MPREFYHPPKTWYPNYVHPFYFPNGQHPRMDDWTSLRRLLKFNFLLHNAVLEPPSAPIPPSRIGPPRKLSELRVLERQRSEYVPSPNGVWEFWFFRRLKVFNFFKYDLTSKFLESPGPPSETIAPNRKRKISDLDEIEY
jgi:hypothetical protein